MNDKEWVVEFFCGKWEKSNMNDKEWVVEFFCGKWEKSNSYKYDPKEGVIPIKPVAWWVDVHEHLDYWNKNRMSYRLIHKPTGKVIPGELL